jgi:transcriptional antiterminator NusG
MVSGTDPTSETELAAAEATPEAADAVEHTSSSSEQPGEPVGADQAAERPENEPAQDAESATAEEAAAQEDVSAEKPVETEEVTEEPGGPPAEAAAEAADTSDEERPPSEDEAAEEAVDDAAEDAVAVAEEEQAEAPPLEPDDGRAWYVVHCYSGDEEKVKHNLEQRTETMQMTDQIFQVVVPTEDEIEIRNGKRRTVERRVFPGYILVQMLLTDDSWYVVRNTPGVTGFVGMGNEPTPLRPEEVQAIVRRMEVEAPKIKVTFKPGQKVRIIDGPFNEFIGVVDEIDMDRAKVRVLVSFFGRETPVELDFLQVEKT